MIILQLSRSSFTRLINIIRFDPKIFFSGIKLNVTANNEPYILKIGNWKGVFYTTEEDLRIETYGVY